MPSYFNLDKHMFHHSLQGGMPFIPRQLQTIIVRVIIVGGWCGSKKARRINWKNNKQTNNNGTYHLNKRVVIYSHPMKYEVLMNYDTSYWKSRVPSHKFPRRPLPWMRQDLESAHQRNEPIRINLVQWWIVSQLHVFYVLFGLKSRWGKQLFLMSLTSYSLEFSAKIEVSQCQPDATNSTNSGSPFKQCMIDSQLNNTLLL